VRSPDRPAPIKRDAGTWVAGAAAIVPTHAGTVPEIRERVYSIESQKEMPKQIGTQRQIPKGEKETWSVPVHIFLFCSQECFERLNIGGGVSLSVTSWGGAIDADGALSYGGGAE
jgi:hypothetical protein